MNDSLKYKLFSNTDCLSEQTLFDYIDKKLSHKEQHVVEKHLLNCEFCSDALEGLSLVKHRTIIPSINAEIAAKTSTKKEAKILFFDYKTITSIAAAIALLIGGVFLFNYAFITNDTDMAVLKEENAVAPINMNNAEPLTDEEISGEKMLEQPISNSSSIQDSPATGLTAAGERTQTIDYITTEETENGKGEISDFKKGSKDDVTGYYKQNEYESTLEKEKQMISKTPKNTNTLANTATRTTNDISLTTGSSATSKTAVANENVSKQYDKSNFDGRFADGSTGAAIDQPKGIISGKDKEEKKADKSENDRYRESNNQQPTPAYQTAKQEKNIPTKDISPADETKKTEVVSQNRAKEQDGDLFIQETKLKNKRTFDNKIQNKKKSKVASARKESQKEVSAYSNVDFDEGKRQNEIAVNTVISAEGKAAEVTSKIELYKNKPEEKEAVTTTSTLTETAVANGTYGGITDSVHVTADEMPVYPGGQNGLAKYLANSISYAGKNLRKDSMSISQTVYVQFIVNKEGKATNPKILKNSDKEIEKSLVNAVNKMPQWKPGRINGKAVDVKYSVPIEIETEDPKSGTPLLDLEKTNNFLKALTIIQNKHIFYFLFFTFLFFYSCKSSKNIQSFKTNNSTEANTISEKYAELFSVEQNQIINIDLYKLIDEWIGTPYKYAGNTKNGIDCSNFVNILYTKIYGKPISGSSASIFNQCKEISKNNLQEGDLVFFKIESNSISHVGVYLINNKFVHATTKKGVMINDLNEEYYKKYFYKSGRLK